MSEQGILNESAVPSGISDPAVNPAIDQPQVPATNVAVSSLPHLQVVLVKNRFLEKPVLLFGFLKNRFLTGFNRFLCKIFMFLF